MWVGRKIVGWIIVLVDSWVGRYMGHFEQTKNRHRQMDGGINKPPDR